MLSSPSLRRISERKRRSQFVFTGFLLAAMLGFSALNAFAHDNEKAADKAQVAGADANTPDKAKAEPVVTAKADNNGDNDRKAGDDNRRAERAAQNRAAQNRAANEARQAMFASRIREMLTKSGFPDATTQDAIIAHLASEEKVKNGVRDATRRLSMAIRRDVPPERMKDLITEYKNAVETERKRKEDARSALDTQIGFSKNPRLEAFLLVAGILGDGSNIRFDMMFQRQWGGPGGGQNNGPQNGPQRGGPNFGPNATPNTNAPAGTNQPYPVYPGAVNAPQAAVQPAEVKPPAPTQ